MVQDYAGQMLDSRLPGLAGNQIADSLRVRLILPGKKIIAGPGKSLGSLGDRDSACQALGLGNRRRDDGKSGGEILVHLDRVDVARHVRSREQHHGTIERTAIGG